MDIKLSIYEARVIGCLLEKEITTPEQYPLSLNALTNACNQKSNRDPVMELSESTVQETLDALVKKRLVSDKSGFGSRVTKYQHRFCNTGFGDLKLSEQELAIICVLMLRGPQTPGELRTRTERLCKFGDVREVETVLHHLAGREDGPFVTRLQREAGKRESRYAHLLSGDVSEMDASEPVTVSAGSVPPTHDRVAQLEHQIMELNEEVARLKDRLADLEAAVAAGNP